MSRLVFISYAREDLEVAKKLYRDFKAADVNPWLDVFDLLPGQKWQLEIEKAISRSHYFIALQSSRSVGKRGHVQVEIARALEVAEQYPEESIFIIPVRIDVCEPSHRQLKKLHTTDLFPSYEEGFSNLLRTLQYPDSEKPFLKRKAGQSGSGTIARLSRGYGFIKRDDHANDIFFHHESLVEISGEDLQEGEAITFLEEKGPKGVVAVFVRRA